jgi:putative acetyltransferase
VARSIAVRVERPGDAAAIRAVHDAAFGSRDEGRIVDDLRGTDRWVPDLSLVATDPDGRIVGHALTSIADLVAADGTARPILALGPIGVLPDRQRRGIGAALVRAGIAASERGVWPLLVVLGHADYYSRFGFEPARAIGIEPPAAWPDAHWLCRRLAAWPPDLRGVVRYPTAFRID